ncbi:transposase for IS1330, partial [mine drainage metagenome]
WVLAVSPALADLSAEEVVGDYARRMQIEESFRDLKDPRHGAALRHSLTRKAPRMEILILLHALASVLAWWRGLLARQQRQDQRL